MFGLAHSFFDYFVRLDAESELLHYLFNVNLLFRLLTTRSAIGANCRKYLGLCQGMGLPSNIIGTDGARKHHYHSSVGTPTPSIATSL